MAPTRRNVHAAAAPITTTTTTTETKSSRVTKRGKKDTDAAVTAEPGKKPATRAGRGEKAEVVPEPEPEEEKEEPAPVKTRKGRGKKEKEPEPEPEPEKKTRGRGKKSEAEVEPEEEEEIPAKTRTGRGKKAVQEEEEAPEPEPVKATRGRGKKSEPATQPEVTTTRGGRGKKAVQEDAEEKEEVPEPEPVRAMRGRGKKSEPAPEPEVPATRGGRGKKAAQKQQPPASPPPPAQEEEKKEEVKPVPRRGGRGKASVAEPEPELVVEAPRKGRVRKQAAADTTPVKQPQMEDRKSIAIQVVVMTPSKKDAEPAPKRRGRGKAAVKEPEPEPQPEEEEQVEQTPRRTGRGKTAEKPAPRATRRKADAEPEEKPQQDVEPVQDEPEVPTRRRGARGKAAPESEATEEPAPKTRRGRAKSPPPPPEPAPKTRRGRAKSPPAPPPAPAEPTRKSAKASKPEEPAEEPAPAVEEPKPRRGRGKAAKAPEPKPEPMEVDAQPELAPTPKPTRRGRGARKDPTPADEDAMEVDEPEKKPPKSTRKPRGKAATVAPSPARASRGGGDKAAERIEQEAVLAPNNAKNRVTKPARKSRRAAGPVQEEEEQQEENLEELLRPKRPGKRRGRSPSPVEGTKEPASKRAFRRREKTAIPARMTFQMGIQAMQESKETEKKEQLEVQAEPEAQPEVEEEQSKSEPQPEPEPEPEMVPEAEVEQIAMEDVPVQQLEEAPEIEEEAEVGQPATIPQDTPVSDAPEEATEEAPPFEPTSPAVEQPEETEPVETEMEVEVADESADSEGIVAVSEDLVTEEIRITVEAPASDAEEDAQEDAQEDDPIAAPADEEDEPELPEPGERDQSRSPPPGDLPQTVHLGTPVMQSSPSRRLSLPAPPMDDDDEPLVASSPRLSPAPKTPHIQKRSSSARSTPRQTDPIQLSSPRRASSGISPTKSPVVPTPSPIKVLEPEYDLPTINVETSPSTPLKQRQTRIGVGSSPIDVSGSPGLSLDPTAPKSSAISPVKHSSPLVSSPVILAEHLGSLSPPSSPVRKHQTRQSSPLKISTPSGAAEGPDFLAENDAPRSSPIESPAKKSSPRQSSVTPADIDTPADEPTPVVGSSPPQLSDVTNTAPRSREPTPQAPKSDTPKPEKESTPPPPPSVPNARHTQANTRGEQPPSPVKHAPGIFSAQKLTPKFAVPGSPAQSSPKRSVSPKKQLANKMMMDELEEGDTTFNAWLEGDTDMTEVETRIEGDSACESMVFPDEGDQSVMFTENMLPDDINNREMDESMDQSSADPFQLEPSDSAQKNRVKGTSWLHGASKLRGSSPLGEESIFDLGDDDDDDQQPDEPSFVAPARKSQKQDNLPSSPIDSSPRGHQATASSPNKPPAAMSPEKKSTPRPALGRVSHYPTPNPSFETEGNSSIFSTPRLIGNKITEPGTITGVHEEREISLLEAVTPNLARTKDSFSSSPQIFSSPPQPSPLKSSSPVTMPMVEGENIFDIHMSPVRRGSSREPSPLKTNISFTEDEAEDMSEIVLPNVGTSKNLVLASPPKKLLPTISNPDIFLFSNEENSRITEGDAEEEDMSFQSPNFRQTTPPSTKPTETPNFSSPPDFESTPKPAPTRTLADTRIPDFGKTTTPRKLRSPSPEPRRALQPQSPKSPFRRQASPAKSRLYMQHNAYSSSPSDTSMFSPVVLPTARQATSAPEVGTPTRGIDESILPGTPAGVSMQPMSSPMRDAELSAITLSGLGVENAPATASPLAQVAVQEVVADNDDESSAFIEDPAELPDLDQPSPIELPPRPTNPTPGCSRPMYNDTSFLSSPFEESVPVASPHNSPLKNAGCKRARSSSPVPEADNSTVDFPPSPKKVAFAEDTVFEPSAPVGKIDFSFKPSGNRRHTGTPGKKPHTPKKSDTWFGKLGISPAVTAKRQAAAAAASLAEADEDATSPERKRARVVSPSGEEPPQFAPMLLSAPETKNPEPFTPVVQETNVAHAEAYEAPVTASVMDVPMEDHAPTTKDAPAIDHAGQSEERLRDVLQTGGSEASGETPATVVENEVEMKEEGGDGVGGEEMGDDEEKEDEEVEEETAEQDIIEEDKVEEEKVDQQKVDDENVKGEQMQEQVLDEIVGEENDEEEIEEEAEEEQGEDKKESPEAPVNAYSTSYLDRFLKKHEKKYQFVSGTASTTSILSTTTTVASTTTTPTVAAAAVAPVAMTPTPTLRRSTPTPRAVSEEPAQERSTDRSIRKKSPIPRIPKPSTKASGGRDGRSKSPSNIHAPGSGVGNKKAVVGNIPRPKASIPVPKSRITKPGRATSSALPIPASAIPSVFAAARSPSPAPPPTAETTKPSKLPARARSARVAAASRPTISLAPNPKTCDVTSMSWDSLPERERKNITKANTSLNCTPTPFPRETTKLPIPRPPSPSPTTQHRTATQLRRKREEYLRRTGVELGPGEEYELPDTSDLENMDSGDEDAGRPMPMSNLDGDGEVRKGVKWNTPLEAGFAEELELHSPSKAKLKQPKGPVIQKKVQLDRNGNVVKEGGEEVAITPGTPVVIRKVLYKGESAD